MHAAAIFAPLNRDMTSSCFPFVLRWFALNELNLKSYATKTTPAKSWLKTVKCWRVKQENPPHTPLKGEII